MIIERKNKDELTPRTIQRTNELIESLGTKISEMKAGEGFGEKALMVKNGKRAASIVTNSNSDFLDYKERGLP